MNISLENKLALNYWINKLELCPLANNNPLTLSETKKSVLEKEALSYFNKLASNNKVPEFTVLLTIYNALLHCYFETVQIIASSGLAKKKQTLLYEFQSIKGNTFKQCLTNVKEEIKKVFKYSNFDESAISNNPFFENNKMYKSGDLARWLPNGNIELLDLEQIGIKDNFFDLGGHSLSVTKLMSSIQREFSIKISINKIFEHPVLDEQSRLIENIQIVSLHNEKQDEETEFENFSI